METPKETAQNLLDQIRKVPQTMRWYRDNIARCETEMNAILEAMASGEPTVELAEDLRSIQRERREYKNDLQSLEVLNKVLAAEMHIQTKLLNVIKSMSALERYHAGETRSYVMKKLPSLKDFVPNGKERP